MALPTNQLSMLACKNLLTKAGLSVTSVSMSDRNMKLIMAQPGVYSNLSLKRARGAIFVAMKPATVDIPGLRVTGWDSAGGPTQAAGATAKGEFFVRDVGGNYATEVKDWSLRRYGDPSTGNYTHGLFLNSDNTFGPDLYLVVGTLVLPITAGQYGTSWNLTAAQYNDFINEINGNGQLNWAVCDGRFF
jgi:hypothetical protein